MTEKTLDEWIISGDTGSSSKTIWAVLKGVKIDNPNSNRFSYPHDSGDFGRCYRLINDCNVSIKDFLRIKDVFKWLAPLIDNWKELSNLYEESKEDRLYERLQELRPKMSKLKGENIISLGKGITINF